MKLFHPLSFILFASLLTGIKGQCETEQSAFEACIFTTLTVDEALACATCLENAPDLSTADTCDEVESIVCGTFSACETTCGTSIDEVESIFDCMWLSETDCGGINCDTGGSGGSNSSGV
jgi:hypothetical protein